MKSLRQLLLAACAAWLPTLALAQSFSYTQNFDSMGTTTAAPSGWQVFGTFGGSNTTWDNTTGIPVTGAISVATAGTANATLTVNSAAASFASSSNTGGYNFALATSTTDRALGSSPTSGAGIVLQLTLTNSSSAAITAINVGYDIRRFTTPATANSLPGYQLFYSLDNGTTWTNVSALNPALTSATVNVPNTAGVTTVPSTTVVLSGAWFAGSSIRFRWVDDNALETSPDQIIALDNVTITGAAFSNAAAPTTALTAPAAGATFTAPATVAIAADASDTDGSVSKVEFFANGSKIGEDITAPFTFSWTGVDAGTYALTTKATDNDGNATFSVARSITVQANPNGPSGAILRGPYLNSANDTSIVIRWRSTNANYGRVLYGTSPDNLTGVTDETVARTDHEVRLTGLTPYTRYYYSVGGAVDRLTPELVDTTSVRTTAYTVPTPKAADYTFRTSPLPGTATDTRIWVVGDCGRGSATQAAGRDAYYNWMGNRVPDLNLQLGDNAYNSGTDAEYQTGYFLMYPSIFRKLPQWSTLGNHDANNGNTTATLNWPYFDMFTFPTAGECGGVASGTEHYYSFDYANVHVICLDSQTTLANSSATAPQTVWLQNDLASTTQTWIIVIFHHPPYSKGSHNSDSESQMVTMRQVYNPILEAGGVDLVLTGHSHNYERSVLLDGHYGISTTITPSMKLNAGNGSTTGYTTSFTTAGDSGKIRNAASGFLAVATVNGAFIPPDGAYIKPLTGPRDHFGTVYNTAGMSGQADGGSLDHTAMYISYDTVGTVNLDISGNTLVATYVQADGNAPDNYTIIKQGAADSDADGISDEYEIANGLNRKNAADAQLDLDGDGLKNGLEYALGTAANSAASANVPAVAFGTGDNAGKLTLTFNRARANVTYTVQASDDLTIWTDLAVNAGTVGADVTVTDTGSASSTRFLRLKAQVGPNTFNTVPSGYLKSQLGAGTPAVPMTTAFGIALDDATAPAAGIRAGRIESFTTTTITQNLGGWTSSLASPEAPWAVRITSGPSAGKLLDITANTATTLTVSGADLTTLGLTAGTDTFELVPMDTLWTLFGSDTLLGGTTAAAADNVQVRSGASWLVYFYDTNLGFWRRTIGPATNSNNVLIRPASGVQIVHRSAATALTFKGRVPASTFRTAITNASSTVVHAGFPTSTTLGSLGVQTLLPGWRSASTAAAADTVALFNGTAWVAYFHNGSFWQPVSGAATNSDSVAVPAGALLTIQRPGTTAGTTDLVRVLPYSL